MPLIHKHNKTTIDMIPIYLVKTTLWNGTIPNVIDVSAFLSKALAEDVKEAVEKANSNSEYKVTVGIETADLFTHEGEVPILNTDKYDGKYGFDDDNPIEAMHNAMVGMAVAAASTFKDSMVDTVTFNADNIQASVKDGKWVPATDSHLALFTPENTQIGESV